MHKKSALRIFKMHAEEEYVVIPRNMPHSVENSYVCVVFDFIEMGLLAGVTLVYPEIWEKKENKYSKFWF